jgi:hypothetical protein
MLTTSTIIIAFEGEGIITEVAVLKEEILTAAILDNGIGGKRGVISAGRKGAGLLSIRTRKGVK